MRRILTMILAATVCVACMETSIDENSNVNGGKKYLYATFEEDTRVELNENMKNVWTAGDQIVRYGTDTFDVWTFDGETGDRNGRFVEYGEFNTTLGYDFGDLYYALYSYHNYVGVGFYNTGEPAIFFNVQGTQKYKKGTYDPESNIMFGVSDNGTNFSFRNLMSYLRLSITGDKVVSHITLKGNNNENLNGSMYAKYDDVDYLRWYDNITQVTTLDCGDGVMLTDEPTHFYFTLPPMTFASGINLTIYFTDGTVFPKSTLKPITIARNTIQPMTTFDTGGDTEWQTITIKHHGDRVSTPYFGGETSMSGIIYWGDGYMSDIITAQSYVYNDNLGEHTIIIKGQNINSFHLENCEGVSEIDFSEF